MEHGVAGDLMLGKMNKSMKKSMARMKSRRKSDGSAKSRKSMANSDLQVCPALYPAMYGTIVPDLQLPSSPFDNADTSVPELAACLGYCSAALLVSQPQAVH